MLGASKTPLIPALLVGVLTILLLVLNIGNQRAFYVLTSVAIIMFYIPYLWSPDRPHPRLRGAVRTQPRSTSAWAAGACS